MALSGLSWVVTILSGLVALLAYGFFRLVRERRFYKDLPCPPHSFFWGHLKIMGETYRLFPEEPHYQVIATTIAQKYNMPGVFYLDLWPASTGQVIVTDPDVALHVTTTRNHPKHVAEKWFIDPLIGADNIVSTNGPKWKTLHKMLSPAFSVSHTTNLRPMVASEVMTFRSILQKKAESGEAFRFEDVAIRMTFDVIGTATFGESLNAQQDGSAALKHFDEMCRLFIQTRESFNFVKNFFVNRKRDVARRKLDAIIADLVKGRFEKLQQSKLDLTSKRGLCIMDLILREHQEELRKSGKQEMDPQFLADAVTQVKTLLVAGSGTTSDTISFAVMLLSIHPEVVQQMREEHDRVFTKGTEATYEMLMSNSSKLNELEYTTNVIKEVLRFFPIGNTARVGLDTVHFQGQDYPTKDLYLLPIQLSMHMNPELFANPRVFDPSRFKREDFPRHAWRPFERGPRACLGQPLAMDELKITLLLLMRDFDFTCADLTPSKTQRVEWCDLDLTFGDRAFQEFLFEAKPRDGMPMTIKKSTWQS